ncbi:hypothetical protein TNCT_340561 [Trichonephila clavata]|uniref:Uncharacterized protein n=1 Tax=Trichonephila clavata TaxID=2740835 RepID=A0A8X6GP33_TRICU|nr:hypothetical protein TNCT_340561 [Trichonephila clavata]
MRTRLFKDLIGEEEKNPSDDPTIGQGYLAEMKSIEGSKRYIVGELTRLTHCPVKYCLHNVTVKTLRKRLATSSTSKPAAPNLESTKNKIKD